MDLSPDPVGDLHPLDITHAEHTNKKKTDMSVFCQVVHFIPLLVAHLFSTEVIVYLF